MEFLAVDTNAPSTTRGSVERGVDCAGTVQVLGNLFGNVGQRRFTRQGVPGWFFTHFIVEFFTTLRYTYKCNNLS